MARKEMHVDVAIIGAGTAGLNALREVKKAGKSFLLIDRGPEPEISHIVQKH